MSKVLIQLVKLVVTSLSPELKSYIKGQLPEWRAKADATSNKFDDVLVGILEALFG